MVDNDVSEDQVEAFEGYTDDYLCKLSDNEYKIKFLRFKVRDLESGYTLFEVASEEEDLEYEITDEDRLIRYHLGPDFLQLKRIGTELTFSVGEKPVKNLVMIERQYFKDKLIKSIRFHFDFCIPNSTNQWETLYEVPDLDEELKEEMIACPWDTKSDSFYFVDGKLCLHHKAIYNYAAFEDQ